MIDFLLGQLVSLFVYTSVSLARLDQPLRSSDNRIVNIMKVYIERNNLIASLINTIR